MNKTRKTEEFSGKTALRLIDYFIDNWLSKLKLAILYAIAVSFSTLVSEIEVKILSAVDLNSLKHTILKDLVEQYQKFFATT